MMGLTNCSEQCVNLTDDPDNCGSCANRCSSGLCLGGVCQQQGVGHVVVIGHDYVVQPDRHEQPDRQLGVPVGR